MKTARDALSPTSRTPIATNDLLPGALHDQIAAGSRENSTEYVLPHAFVPRTRRTQLDTALSPTMEPMSVARKNSLQNVAGSLKKRIPKITVPTAPIPVQTG